MLSCDSTQYNLVTLECEFNCFKIIKAGFYIIVTIIYWRSINETQEYFIYSFLCETCGFK